MLTKRQTDRQTDSQAGRAGQGRQDDLQYNAHDSDKSSI